jgi:hypothetical protein
MKANKDENEKELVEIEKAIGAEITEPADVIKAHVEGKTYLYKGIGAQISLKSIIRCAVKIKSLFYKIEEVQSRNHSTSKVHGVQHVKNVLLLSNYLGIVNGISDKKLKVIREAAIYHDICHEKAGDPNHARIGAQWYLENVDTRLNKKAVAYLIESHELNSDIQFQKLADKYFPRITEQCKKELIICAKILQDADRLDILRYDIENPNFQRFQPERLNNCENTRLISAVLELNTRQAIRTGYLHMKERKIECYEIKKEDNSVEKSGNSSKFDNGTINNDLQKIANRTSLFGFNKMSDYIKKICKKAEFEKKESSKGER